MSDLAVMLYKLEEVYELLDAIVNRLIELEEERDEDRERIAELEAVIGELEVERPLGSLTEREMQVLIMIAQGCSNKQIADRLTIAEKTVRTHVGTVLPKLKVASRTQAMLWALEHGVLSLDEAWESVKTREWGRLPEPHRNGNGKAP